MKKSFPCIERYAYNLTHIEYSSSHDCHVRIGNIWPTALPPYAISFMVVAPSMIRRDTSYTGYKITCYIVIVKTRTK